MAYNASASSSKKMMMVDNQKEKTAIVADFPDDVIENIISFLPLKKSFSTGLIAKRFLHSWRFSRDLSFDIDFRTLADRADIFNIIKFVMDEHRGPVIGRLRIILDPSGNENQVHDWIRRAIAKGVQELDLNFSAGIWPFQFPSGTLGGARLHVLKICYCDLDSLNQFDGLRYLKTIALEDVHVPRVFTDAIFSNCLVLENFEMIKCVSEHYLVIEADRLKNFKSLKVVHLSNLLNMYIDSPSLRVFHYMGDICHIVLKREMPKIEEALLHFNPSRSINLFPGVENLIMGFRWIKVLSISSCIVERLCARFRDLDYKEFYFCLGNLKEIRLYLGGSRGTFVHSTNLNPYDIACFLSKSPCMEKLTIDFGRFPMESGFYWQLVAKYEFENCFTSFKFLNSVCFMNFKFLNLEMQLAKFIITNAKVLEHCVIVKAKRYRGAKEDELDFVSMMAAERLNITIYEHNKYTSC